MGPTKSPKAVSHLKKKDRNTIELKKEIIEKYERGMKIVEISRLYNKPPSTISSIVAKKEAIKNSKVAKGVNMLTKQRSQTVEDVELLLLSWINEKHLDGEYVTDSMLCEKARQLYADLTKMPGASERALGDFKASRGWAEKFKRRTGIDTCNSRWQGVMSNQSWDKKCTLIIYNII